jgi:GTP-binding protein
VLGVVDDGVNKMTWAELPGLVKDSSHGKGLGNGFLHHAGRALVIVYLLDAGSADMGRDFVELSKEVKAFDDGLAQKSVIIAVNKVDTVDDADTSNYVNKMLTDTGLPVMMVSALEVRGLSELVLEVHRMAIEARKGAPIDTTADVIFRPQPVDRRDR